MKYIIYSCLVWLSLSACQSFEDLQIDPNRPVAVGPDLLLTGLEESVCNDISLGAALASRYLVNTDGASLEQYYGWQRASFSSYEQLRQVRQMEEEALRLERPAYLALAKFFRSYVIINLTQTFGDVPYSEAMSAFEGAYQPAYDRQQDIYQGVLEELEEANQALSESDESISGDLIYGGNIQQWRKLINTFRLRVLMSLSNKSGNTSLNIVEQFRQISSNPAQYPVFESSADNAALPFYNRDNNRYPFFNDNGIQTAYYMEESFVNLLKERQDPRLFRIAAPDFNAREVDKLPATDWNAYSGLGGSADLTTNINRLNSGEGSPIASRYYLDPVNEPATILGYAELSFILAEATARGWISGDAATYYAAGIQASMQFYGIAEQDINSYLQQPAVVYNPASGLEMILTQKYLAFFLQPGWEAFYNQRRTGIPTFSTDGGGILNGGRIPKRWMYPENELNLNQAHVLEAIERQYGGSDNINESMWLLQAE